MKDFGSHLVGTASDSQNFVITNTGMTAAGPLVTSLAGANADQFSSFMDSCDGQTLAAAAGMCSVTVTFNPTSAGQKERHPHDHRLRRHHRRDAGGDRRGHSPVTISPEGVDFGNQAVGTSSGVRVFTITNVAPSGVGLSTSRGGMDPDDFALVNNTCVGALPPGATCQIGVVFTPSSAGGKFAGVIVGASASFTTIFLGGTGVEPTKLGVSPGVKDFGSRAVGATSDSQNFVFTNTGMAPVGPLVTVLDGADPDNFSSFMDLCKGQTLAAAGVCSVTVTFKPTSAGLKNANLTVSGPGVATAVMLVGTGAATTLRITPAMTDFGMQRVGTTSGIQTFTVANTGMSVTGSLSTSVSGSNAGQFAVLGDSCSGSSIAPGESCSIHAIFSPTTTGDKSATLTVSSAGATASSSWTGTALQAQ